MKGNNLKIKEKPIELPNEGIHNSTCLSLIDLGTHFDEKLKQFLRQFLLTFELEDRDSEGNRFLYAKIYTQGTHKKSNLRKAIEVMKGKMSDKEVEGLELKSMLGEGAFLNIERDDKGNTKFASISPLPESMEKLQLEKEVLYFSIDDWPENEGLFETLSPMLKKKIQHSKEWEEIKKESPEKAGVTS